MTSGSDMPADPTSLTPEERTLAQRLARLGPHGEPSPALDTRILAAAHDAVTRAPARPMRRRWPVALGIAASLVLAIGIAWQLRPLPDTTATYQSEVPSAAPLAASSTHAAAADAAMESAAVPAPVTAPQTAAARSAAAMQPPVDAPAIAAESEPAEPTPSIVPMPAPAPPPATPAEPEIVFDTTSATPAPARQSAAATAAPRAFNAAPLPGQPATPTAGDKHKVAPVPPTTDAAPTDIPETDTLDRLQASGTRSALASDEPGADVPPATMASPQARDAWLARIRELVRAGKTDAARASLHEFLHRYPDYRLPDDLRALEQ